MESLTDGSDNVEDKETQKVVFVSSCLIDLFKIDEKTQTFEGEFIVRARWESKMNEHITSENSIDPNDIWTPRLYIQNANVLKVVTRINVDKMMSDTVWLVQILRISGSFTNNIDVHLFPFDLHELTLNVKSEYQVDICELKVDYMYDSTALPRFETCKDLQWKIYKTVEILLLQQNKLILSHYHDYSILQFQFKISRILRYYLVNYFLLHMSLIIYSLFIILTDTSSYGSYKSSLCLWPIFLSIVLEIAIKHKRQNVSYFTYLDIYSVVMLFYHCGVAFAIQLLDISASNGMVMQDIIKRVNYVYCGIAVFIVIAIHVIYILTTYSVGINLRTKYDKLDELHAKLYAIKKISYENDISKLNDN